MQSTRMWPFSFYVNVQDSASWPTLLVAHHPPKPCQPSRPLIMTCGQPVPSAQQLTPPIRPGSRRSSLSQGHLLHALNLFNPLVPSSEAISIEKVLTSPIHRKVLSNKIDNHLFTLLLEQSSPADRACLLSVSSTHAASWVSVIPSEGLGLHLQPSEFQVAIKWWLGLDTSGGSICPLCPGRVLDPLAIMHSPASMVEML